MENTVIRKRNIRAGVILSYVNMAVSILMSLFLTNLILDYIGDYNYGLFSFVNSITSWLTVVSSALTASFVRFSSIEQRDTGDDTSKINTIYLKLFAILGLSILVVGLAILIPLYVTKTNMGSYSWEDSQRIYIIFALTLFNISLTMPANVFTLYVSFKQKYIYSRIMTLMSTVISYVGQFLLAMLTRDIISFAFLSIGTSIFFFIINYTYSRRHLHMTFSKAKLSDNKLLIRSIIAFSGIILFNTIVDQINSSVDKTLLGFMATPEDVTIYQLGQNFGTYLTTMSVAVSGVFVPTINEMVVNEDDEAINQLYLKISRVQLLILTVVTFGFLSCGKTFIILWLGEERVSVYYVAIIRMLLLIGPLSMNSCIEIQRARNKHKFRAILYFILALANVGISVLFLVIFPIEYAVYSCLLGTVITTFFSHWIAMNIYNYKVMKLPIKQYVINLIKYIVIGAAAFGLVFLFDYLFIGNITNLYVKFFVEGSIFVVLYFIFFFIIEHKYFMELWGMLMGKLRRKKA